MELRVLASGSSGNALWVKSGKSAVFVDCGLRKRRLRQRLTEASFDEAAFPDAVFVTHEHSDHTAGIDDLAARGLVVYTTAGTAGAAAFEPLTRSKIVEIGAGHEVAHGSLRVLPLPLPHDAREPVAFVLSDGVHRLGVVTDCGYADPNLAQALATCDALVLECNHDLQMLRRGPYPKQLQDRIASDEGHLSNEEAGKLLRLILEGGGAPRLLLLAHLSKANNTKERARSVIQRALASHSAEILIAEQDHALPTVSLSALPPKRQRPPAQLGLPF